MRRIHTEVINQEGTNVKYMADNGKNIICFTSLCVVICFIHYRDVIMCACEMDSVRTVLLLHYVYGWLYIHNYIMHACIYVHVLIVFLH